MQQPSNSVGDAQARVDKAKAALKRIVEKSRDGKKESVDNIDAYTALKSHKKLWLFHWFLNLNK